MRKSLAWILEQVCKLPEEEQIKALQQNDNSAIRTILKFCYAPEIKWILPPGAPPYTPCEFPNIENMLYSEARRLYLFVEGGNPNLTNLKRETMFIDLLQSVTPDDAKLLIAIKDKKLPYEGKLTKKTILKAYPGLF